MDISIIIPLYKGKKYISNIVDMINENQKILIEHNMQKDIEVIFVNDYPMEQIEDTDIEENNNIHIHLFKNTQNLGIHESRVIGLSKARGSYIVFLDQDDEISPFYLWRQLRHIGESDAVLCNGFYRKNKMIYQDEKHQNSTVSINGYLKEGDHIVSPGQVMIKSNSIPYNWKKYILKENGSDDVFLWILMLCGGRRFALNPNFDYIHKEDGENLSLNFSNMKQSIENLLMTIKREQLLSEKDLLIFERVLQKKIDKHTCYKELLENWQKILDKLIEFCAVHKSNKIAIYGNGIIGKKLVSDLEYRGIEPRFIIDKSASNFNEKDYKIYDPENIPEKVDLIIITPVFAEKEIRNELEKYKINLISLNEFEI